MKKVKLLIAQGADLYKRSSWGYYPILSAGQKGRVEIVKLMLDAGFDPNAKNPFGGTMLHGFVAYATPSTTKVMIEYGAEVNALDGQGQLPIHWAAWRSTPEMIEFLIAKGERPSTESHPLLFCTADCLDLEAIEIEDKGAVERLRVLRS